MLVQIPQSHSNLREEEVCHLVSILYSFEKCPVVHIHLDYLQRYYNRSCQIIGEYGTITWDYNSHQVHWYDSRRDVWHIHRVQEGLNDMYVKEVEHFFECLKLRKNTCQTVEDAVCVQQMADDIQKSLVC